MRINVTSSSVWRRRYSPSSDSHPVWGLTRALRVHGVVWRASFGEILDSSLKLVLLGLRTLLRCSGVHIQPTRSVVFSVMLPWAALVMGYAGFWYQHLPWRTPGWRCALASLKTFESCTPVQMLLTSCSTAWQIFKQKWNLRAHADSQNYTGWVKIRTLSLSHTHTHTHEVNRARPRSKLKRLIFLLNHSEAIYLGVAEI